MKAAWRLATIGVGTLVVMTTLVSAGAPQHAPPAPVKPAKKPAPAWPDAATLAERRKNAEGRALFSTETPLEFTLTADFKTVNKDRDPNSRKVFPATVTVARADGTPATLPLKIRTRGHARRMLQTCTFAPLRLEFDPNTTKGTVFEGHKNLKLGTHCRDADLFEQYVPREYGAYRIFNLLTPRSFRARLATATYVEAATQKPIANRMALFIEDDDDVARRLEGRIAELQKLVFRQVDYDAVTLMALFEYMIGNTDMSMYLLHNVVLVQRPGKMLIPVPYDFDYSGLVDARYALPAKQFGLTSVRDRLYLGPCRTAAEYEPFFQQMLAVKAQTLALFDTIPALEPNYRKNSQKYLERFYQTISKPSDAKKAFIDGCGNRAGM